MEEKPPQTVPMEGLSQSQSHTQAATRIMRKSIHTFLQNYHYFTLTSALIAFPYSVSFLLSQDLVLSASSPLLHSFYTHFNTLFRAANFPGSSKIFLFGNLKLSQAISSSLLTLPFTVTFLLASKALIFHCLSRKSSGLPCLSNYGSILRTYLCSWFVLLAANSTAFFLLFFAFNSVERFEFSQSSSSLYTRLMTVFGVVVYSILLANSMVVCSLALVLSGVERIGGSDAIIKACLLIRGRTSTALSLALPLNLALVATEALFEFRVSRFYHEAGSPGFVMVGEGMFIAYLYSVLLVLDTVVGFIFYKSCKMNSSSENPEEGGYYWQIQIPHQDSEFHDIWNSSAKSAQLGS